MRGAVYLGDSTTDFVRRFKSERMFKEITAADIDKAYDDILLLGPASKNKIDSDALEETLEILEFLKKYKDDDTVRVIMSDDL